MAFPDFWQVVWRRVGKRAAEKSYAAAIKRGATDKQILDGALRYAAETADREPRFKLHPATWLNGERWNDEPGGNGGDQQLGSTDRDRQDRAAILRGVGLGPHGNANGYDHGSAVKDYPWRNARHNGYHHPSDARADGRGDGNAQAMGQSVQGSDTGPRSGDSQLRDGAEAPSARPLARSIRDDDGNAQVRYASASADRDSGDGAREIHAPGPHKDGSYHG